MVPAYAVTKSGGLHARPDCPHLRAHHVSELRMTLNAVSIERMCAECARWGRWTLPGTVLGIYLEAVSGYGLPHQLDSGIKPDLADLVTDKEITDATALLRCGEYRSSEATDDTDEEPDEDKWNALPDGPALRRAGGTVFSLTGK